MNQYDKQASDFLAVTSTRLSFIFAGQNVPRWGDTPVNTFYATLTRKKDVFRSDSDEIGVSIQYFDSIHNTEKSNQSNTVSYPSSYDFLACLDQFVPSDLQEFIDDFGYEYSCEKERDKVVATHKACLEQQEKLNLIFNAAELDLLAEIQ